MESEIVEAINELARIVWIFGCVITFTILATRIK